MCAVGWHAQVGLMNEGAEDDGTRAGCARHVHPSQCLATRGGVS